MKPEQVVLIITEVSLEQIRTRSDSRTATYTYRPSRALRLVNDQLVYAYAHCHYRKMSSTTGVDEAYYHYACLKNHVCRYALVYNRMRFATHTQPAVGVNQYLTRASVCGTCSRDPTRGSLLDALQRDANALLSISLPPFHNLAFMTLWSS